MIHLARTAGKARCGISPPAPLESLSPDRPPGQLHAHADVAE